MAEDIKERTRIERQGSRIMWFVATYSYYMSMVNGICWLTIAAICGSSFLAGCVDMTDASMHIVRREVLVEQLCSC